MLDFLISDRFHSSIFTLKLAGAPVVFIESSAKWPDPNSKGRDLFERIGIQNMVWRYEGGDVPSDLVEKYLKTWKCLNIILHKNISILYTTSLEQLSTVKKIIA